MSAVDRLGRLLALVPWLTANPAVTIRQCAEHFGVAPSQIESDLCLLIVSGDEVLGAGRLVDIAFWADDDPADEARFDARVTVVDPQGLARPMRLSSGEATALLAALRLIAQLPGVADTDAAASATAKLEQAAGRIESPDVAIDVEVDPAVRAVVDRAIADGHDVDIVYAAGTSGEVTERTVSARRVVAVDGVGYLDAWCHRAGAQRTFRLDRITRATAASSPTRIRGEEQGPGAHAEALPAPATTVVLDLHPQARWVADVHHGTIVQEADDGTVRARFAVHDPDWAIGLVLSLAGAATVREPAGLAARVAARANDALAAYPDPQR